MYVADPGDQRRGFVRLGGIDVGLLHGWQATRQLDEIEAAVGSVTREPERVAGPLEKTHAASSRSGSNGGGRRTTADPRRLARPARRRSVAAAAGTRLNLMS
jgi:hypothetical protein